MGVASGLKIVCVIIDPRQIPQLARQLAIVVQVSLQDTGCELCAPFHIDNLFNLRKSFFRLRMMFLWRVENKILGYLATGTIMATTIVLP